MPAPDRAPARFLRALGHLGRAAAENPFDDGELAHDPPAVLER